MRIFILLITLIIITSSANEALAKSPAERAKYKQPTEFESRTLPSSQNRSITPLYPPADQGEVVDDEGNKGVCGNRWLGRIGTAMGSVTGVILGGNVGSGTGRQVGRIIGGAAGGIATEEAKEELCD